MMGVLWFVFTKIFPGSDIPNFPAYVLCGLVPYNFFTIAWVSGTTSIQDNASLIKRVTVPRVIIPITAVLSNVVHLGIQIALLIMAVLLAAKLPNWNWFWLLFLWGCEIAFVCGLSLIFSALNVYIRDIRYVVESCNVVLFWLVPIFYSTEKIAPQYVNVFQFNPVAALVMASRYILLDGVAPPETLLYKLVLSSGAMLLLGLLIFRKLQSRFYNFL
jgi:ABC-type polysaccharide/polyol phosphate export permease